MRAQQQQRREFAAAVAGDSSQPPDAEELLRIQRNQADQISRLSSSLKRQQRWIGVGLLMIGSIIVTFVSLGTFLYLRPDVRSRLVAEAMPDRPVERPEGFYVDPNSLADSVVDQEQDFKIRTDVDYKYQILIRRLFGNSSRLRPMGREIEYHNVATHDYIKYMSDVSRACEQAAQEQASPEILQALINLSLIGPKRHRVERWRLDIETRNRMDQIRYVLRARDVRASQRPGQEGSQELKLSL